METWQYQAVDSQENDARDWEEEKNKEMKPRKNNHRFRGSLFNKGPSVEWTV